MRFRKVFLERRGFRVSTVRAEATNAYSRIMHSATVRGVHQPSVSNELNCTGKRAGVREWKGRPCLSSVARVPRAGSPAACLHVTPGGPTYHVLRVHTHTRAHGAHENRLAPERRAPPLNYREAGFEVSPFSRLITIFRPFYSLLSSFRSPLYPSTRIPKSGERSRRKERRGGGGIVFLALIFRRDVI